MTRSNLPRWAKVSLIVAVSLVTIFYLAGGIVFANMIRSDALAPEPPTHDYGVYVVAVSDDTITLTSEEERDDTTRPGFAGLYWSGGYGLLGEIRGTDGLTVTREFELTHGSSPKPCLGELAGCEAVDIEGYTYETDPSDVGLEFEEVTFPSPIGTFGAWRVDGGDGSLVAIHVHGWRAARREAVRTLRTYHDLGFTSLVIDYRNDVGAPADPSGLYRFGRTEWEDLESAVQFALDNGAETVVLHGYSTGSALILSFLEKSDLAGAVTAAVHDSPNIDMAESVRHGASKRSIPGTPIPVPGSLAAMAMFIADLRWDVAWSDIDYADRGGEIVDIPMLVFHGTEDDVVPIDVSRRFRQAAGDLVRLQEVPEAGHVTSWNVDPDSYETMLESFLDGIES